MKKAFLFILLFLSVAGLFVYSSCIYEPVPLPPRTKDSPWLDLYDPHLWGDFAPNRDIVASISQSTNMVVHNDIIYSYHINKMGLRGNDQIITDNTKKFLLLGDGNAFGIGLSKDEDIASQLAIMLQKDYPNKSIAVLNGAHPGYSITDELDYLREKISYIQPNLVIIIVAADDIWEISRPIILRQAYKKSVENKIYDIYYTIRWEWIFYNLFTCKNNYLKSHKVSEEKALEELIPEYIKSAINLKDMVFRYGGGVLFVLSDDKEGRYLKAAMATEGLAHVFIEYPAGAREKYHLEDGHWTAEMCKFIAQKIRERIKEDGDI